MTREGGRKKRERTFLKRSRGTTSKERREKKEEGSIVFWDISGLLGKKRISVSI